MHGVGIQVAAPPGFNETGTRIDPPLDGEPMGGDVIADGVPYDFVNRLDLSLSAGSGFEAAEGALAERMAFSRDWFLQRGLAADFCVLVRVRGDSMDPTVPDGCLVLLNRVEQAPVNGGIFALRLDGEVYVKRILPDNGPDGRPSSVVIFSDNRRYPPVILRGARMNDLRLIGRVRLVVSDV